MVISVRTFRYADEFSDELAISMRAMWKEKEWLPLWQDRKGMAKFANYQTVCLVWNGF